MPEAYDGQQFVGMDLHRRRSVLVRMTADGRKLGMARVSRRSNFASPPDKALKEFLEP